MLAAPCIFVWTLPIRSARAEIQLSFEQESQKNVVHHGLALLLNICQLPNLQQFSLVITFKFDYR